MIARLWLAILMALTTAVAVRAATVTGSIADATGTLRTNAWIRFQPISTPQVDGGVVLTSGIVSAQATDGTFSVTLEQGDYRVSIAGRDQFIISVPNDSSTNVITDLVTSSLTYIYTAPPIWGFFTNGVWLITQGGTGATNALGARAALELGEWTTNSSPPVVGGAFTNITSLPVPIAQGGTESTNSAGARTALGLGTMAVVDAPVPVDQGGTGASSASTALLSLGAYPASSVSAFSSNTFASATAYDWRVALDVGDLSAADYMGPITATNQALADPSTNAGKWYGCSVAGTLTGAYAGSAVVVVGDRMLSNGGTNWYRYAAPTVSPGTVSWASMTPAVLTGVAGVSNFVYSEWNRRIAGHEIQTTVSGTGTNSANVGYHSAFISYSATIAGWGSKWRTNGVAFNAVRIPQVRIYTNATVRPYHLRVEVKTCSGTGDGGVNTNVVAYGTAVVPTSASVVTNLTILLRDPTTGAAKRITDADLTDPFFIGWWSYTTNLSAAQISGGYGYSTNYEGNSFYLTTSTIPAYGSHSSGWANYSGDWCYLVDRLDITNAAETVLWSLRDGVRFSDTMPERVRLDAIAGRRTVTTCSSSNVTAACTGPSYNALYSASITGWGQKYRTNSETWNTVRIPYIYVDTQVATASRPSYIQVEVKNCTATGDGGITNGCIAYGLVKVPPDWTLHTNTVVLLRDPGTGLPITISDAMLTDPYFVGFYGFSSAYVRAPCYHPIGAMTSREGNSFYTTTGPIFGAYTAGSSWVNYSGDHTVPIERLLMTSPVESDLEIIRSIVGWGSNPFLDIPVVVNPPAIYGVAGRELNVYYHGLMARWDQYHLDVNYASGNQETERWTWPSPTATSGAWLLDIYGSQTYLKMTSATGVVSVASASAGGGAALTLLCVGDSTMAGGTVTGELLTIDAADTNLSLTLIGTKGTGTNLHEGVSGRTYTWFASDAASPFVTGGAFDFNWYLTNNALATPTHVLFNLGINDGFSSTTDPALNTAWYAAKTYIDTMLTNIMAVVPTAKVALCLPVPGAYSQDASGNNYGVSTTRLRYQRNMLLWANLLIASYGGRTAEGLYVVPISVAINPEYGYPYASATPVASRITSVTVTRMNNLVHPNTEGYYQIAEMMWAWLKNVL